MKRSFHVHVFLMTLLGVALFLGAARISVRFFADDLLLNYFNETLAHHAAREIEEAGLALDVGHMSRNLSKTIDDLKPGELRVSLDDPSYQQADLQWQPLRKQSEKHPVASSYVTTHGQVWSVLRTPVLNDSRQLYIAVQRQALERSLEEVLAIRDATTQKILPVILLFAVMCSFFISYTSFYPVNELQKSFAKIEIHRRDEHISSRSNYKEFAEFIHYFNALIDRLRSSYEQAARFSSDVSHELRTPLTIVRGHIDRLLQQAEDNSEQQIKLALVGDEVERLISITDKLLLLARADAGELLKNPARMNFSDRLGQKVDDLAIYSERLEVTCRVAPKIHLECDEALIELLLSNLFNNAVKYNVSHGWIKVSAQTDGENLQFSIHNTTHLSLNSGMDERVFDRFYRHRETSDQSSSSATGSGLGLSLCREIVKAHGGTIHLLKASDQSVGFEITLPLG